MLKRITMLALAVSLALGSLSLVGCGGSQEQDNCYGDDLPALKES